MADAFNQTVRKITPGGLVSTVAGLTDTKGSADGIGASARFFNPWDVAVDDRSNLYVCEDGNQTIRMITQNGFVSTVGGLAMTKGSVDGIGASARFNNPLGLAVDSLGNIYVADYSNHTIRMGSRPLSVHANGMEIILSWGDPAVTLEEADDVTGPWKSVVGPSTSPRLVPITANRKFYRLRK